METESRRSTERYSAVARVLHWLIAGMIVLQYVLANMADNSESKFRELVLTANHKSVGITILVLVVARLAWRLYKGSPAPLPMPRWQHVAAAISHWGFYLLLIVLPLSGWLMSSASNIPVSWFNLFQLPDFVAPNETTEQVFHEVHETLAKVLFVLALVHIGAAMKHAIIDKDSALKRIASPASLVMFVVIIIIGVTMLIPEARGQDNMPAEWTIDYEKSYIRFTAEQAGAEFVGQWKDWEATLQFDPVKPEVGSFDVSIRVAGVDTQDQERDETLMDPEFFDGENFPLAHYRATEFVTLPERFIARGMLEIKGNSTPVELEFEVEYDEGQIFLDGTATLDRLILEIGTGEWEDTAWIGQFVDVAVRVKATIGR